jgi:glycosyltransferase involved in cell wall biosynthesis
VKIGVNLLPLRPRVMGGAEIYLRDLLAEILATGEHDLVLVTGREVADAALPAGPRCRQVRLAARARGLVPALSPVRTALARARRLVGRDDDASLRALIRRQGVDLWFCPFADLRPRAPGVPGVVTVHDLQHEFLPEFFSARELRHRRRYAAASCAAASHVIAVSEFTRRTVLDRFAVDPGRVTVIWEAAGRDVDWTGGAARVAEVRRRYALPRRYAFYPANDWPHKNHVRLVDALARCRARGAPDLGLVLTGEWTAAPAQIEPLGARFGLGDAVRTLGYVPRADLPALYAGAVCLVHPSLFEGFGIPLVEAMQVGCPIVAAEGGALREVAGDAALFFDPRDPAAIAEALVAVASDPPRAAGLGRRGRARAALFSAPAMARRTLDLFERVRQAGPARG